MPHPHLFAVLFAAAVPSLKHRSPAARPAEVDAGDARTRARARSREGAQIRVNLHSGALRRTQLEVGLGGTGRVLSSTQVTFLGRALSCARPLYEGQTGFRASGGTPQSESGLE